MRCACEFECVRKRDSVCYVCAWERANASISASTRASASAFLTTCVEQRSRLPAVVISCVKEPFKRRNVCCIVKGHCKSAGPARLAALMGCDRHLQPDVDVAASLSPRLFSGALELAHRKLLAHC